MKTYFGLDIGSTQVKMVEAGFSGSKIYIEQAYTAPVNSKLLLSDARQDQEELSRVLKTMLRDSGIKERTVHISLPETRVYTRVIQMPLLTDKELVQALRWEAERYVPLPLDEVNMDSAVLVRYADRKQMDVLLVASPLWILNKYISVLESTGLSITSFESETLPIVRMFQDINLNRLVVDIGEAATTIIIQKKGVINLVRTIGIGGSAFTRALTNELSVPTVQAEEYKKTYGLLTTQESQRILTTLSPLVDNLASELTQSMTYFKEKYPEEIMNQIVLIGGGGQLPGMSQAFSDRLQIETIVGNPWQGASMSQKVKNMESKASMFTIATGLALYERG